MHWFYFSDINTETFQTEPDESKHISRVLRLKNGDDVMFTDGKGQLARCRLADANPKACTFTVVERQNHPRPSDYKLHIAVAPTKNLSRIEWFLEKATEIGISEITPIECDHSERIRIKPDRFERIAIAALKQSRQTWLPIINPLTPLSRVLDMEFHGQKCIAYVDDAHDTLLKDYYMRNRDVLILIGPEGDFSKEEIKNAIDRGFKPISLGQNRLRTETAALVACHTIVLMNQ